MLNTTEFTHPELDGLTGLTWGGQAISIFANRESADRALQALRDARDDVMAEEEASVEFRVVSRDDGKFLIAVIDNSDETFFYADARGLPGA